MYFEKWQALGNHFVLVFDPVNELALERAAARLCDRYTGVGADGILLVRTGEQPSMRVLNADGSYSEMCGNGIRCVVGAVAERRVSRRGHVLLQTGAGAKHCAYEGGEGMWQVTVDMGVPSFRPEDAGFTDDLLPLHGVSTAIGAGHVASVGNPHWVFFGADATLAPEWGPRLETDVRFARRTNVEFVKQHGPTHLSVVVWERGVGFTQACGSGAVCVTALATATGRVPVATPIRVDLPGGALTCEVLASGSVLMSGPAQRVFTGALSL
jgi:diaminopimelate epimerase